LCCCWLTRLIRLRLHTFCGWFTRCYVYLRCSLRCSVYGLHIRFTLLFTFLVVADTHYVYLHVGYTVCGCVTTYTSFAVPRLRLRLVTLFYAAFYTRLVTFTVALHRTHFGYVWLHTLRSPAFTHTYVPLRCVGLLHSALVAVHGCCVHTVVRFGYVAFTRLFALLRSSHVRWLRCLVTYTFTHGCVCTVTTTHVPVRLIWTFAPFTRCLRSPFYVCGWTRYRTFAVTVVTRLRLPRSRLRLRCAHAFSFVRLHTLTTFRLVLLRCVFRFVPHAVAFVVPHGPRLFSFGFHGWLRGCHRTRLVRSFCVYRWRSRFTHFAFWFVALPRLRHVYSRLRLLVWLYILPRSRLFGFPHAILRRLRFAAFTSLPFAFVYTVSGCYRLVTLFDWLCVVVHILLRSYWVGYLFGCTRSTVDTRRLRLLRCWLLRLLPFILRIALLFVCTCIFVYVTTFAVCVTFTTRVVYALFSLRSVCDFTLVTCVTLYVVYVVAFRLPFVRFALRLRCCLLRLRFSFTYTFYGCCVTRFRLRVYTFTFTRSLLVTFTFVVTYVRLPGLLPLHTFTTLHYRLIWLLRCYVYGYVCYRSRLPVRCRTVYVLGLPRVRLPFITFTRLLGLHCGYVLRYRLLFCYPRCVDLVTFTVGSFTFTFVPTRCVYSYVSHAFTCYVCTVVAVLRSLMHVTVGCCVVCVRLLRSFAPAVVRLLRCLVTFRLPTGYVVTLRIIFPFSLPWLFTLCVCCDLRLPHLHTLRCYVYVAVTFRRSLRCVRSVAFIWTSRIYNVPGSRLRWLPVGYVTPFVTLRSFSFTFGYVCPGCLRLRLVYTFTFTLFGYVCLRLRFTRYFGCYRSRARLRYVAHLRSRTRPGLPRLRVPVQFVIRLRLHVYGCLVGCVWFSFTYFHVWFVRLHVRCTFGLRFCSFGLPFRLPPRFVWLPVTISDAFVVYAFALRFVRLFVRLRLVRLLVTFRSHGCFVWTLHFAVTVRLRWLRLLRLRWLYTLLFVTFVCYVVVALVTRLR